MNDCLIQADPKIRQRMSGRWLELSTQRGTALKARETAVDQTFKRLNLQRGATRRNAT